MATLKHISSKNADYGAAEAYLTFQHDEFTMKPTLDENGRLVPREDYRIAALNCGEEDFAVACMRANLRYGKNQKREDVKSHHYIISFDPRDGTENGLTVDRAQALGMEFAAAQFPGHQALVCTHPDGHNHSGNIHVHIVINSLRIEAVPMLPYMDRPADMKAGMKHRCTDAAMEYFKSEVMELCHREQLYQIDLLHGSKNRVTEREYWARKKGQLAQDRDNEKRLAAGEPLCHSKFETDKEKLRQTIRKAIDRAGSFEDFSALLLQQGVTVKESRGRLSYLTPDRTKPITARKLGDDFDRAAVLAVLEQNAQRYVAKRDAPEEAVQNGKPIAEPHTGMRLQNATPSTQPPTVGRLVDREKAREKGVGYDRWASVYNLKQMAATVNAYQAYGFSSPEELEAAVNEAYSKSRESGSAVREIEVKIQEKQALRKQVLNYLGTKEARAGLRAQKNGKKRDAYLRAYESDFIISDAATRYLKAHGVTKTLPSVKKLNAEIETLISEKNAAYTDYHAKKAKADKLHAIKRNVDAIMRGSQPQRRKEHEPER